MWFCQLSIGRRFVHASVVTYCLTELLVIGQLKVTIIHRFAQSKGHNYSIRCWLEQGLITFCPILKLSNSFPWLGRYGRYTGVYAPMYPFSDAPSRLCSLTRKVGLSCRSTDLDAPSACRSANIKRSHLFILKRFFKRKTFENVLRPTLPLARPLRGQKTSLCSLYGFFCGKTREADLSWLYLKRLHFWNQIN